MGGKFGTRAVRPSVRPSVRASVRASVRPQLVFGNPHHVELRSRRFLGFSGSLITNMLRKIVIFGNFHFLGAQSADLCTRFGNFDQGGKPL